MTPYRGVSVQGSRAKAITKFALHTRTFSRPISGYVCPNCLYRNALNQARSPKKHGVRTPRPARRAASTIASATAINAKKDVPHAFQGLHDALNVLQREAAVYANLSQVQLALRGLESENGITRVAVLGGPDGRQTRRLVKALLADPLATKPEWEEHLASLDNEDGRALLLRYAETLEFDQRHPLVRTLSMPSIILENHSLEILIQGASKQSEANDAGAQLYLVPGLESQTSASGRFQTVTYPVHKALILAPGLDGIRTLLTSSKNRSSVGESMVIAVIDTPWITLSGADDPLYPLKAINLDRGEEAIATFRQSLDNSFNYEHIWFESGLPQVSAWLIEGTEALPGVLKPTIRRLIETVNTLVEYAIDQEESEQLQKQASSVVPNTTRDTMDEFLANWAEAAHTELRDGLDLAFESKNWRKLAWWKLFWRVDDVTVIASDILRQSWLVDADRGIIYLAGRIEQAGLLPPLPPTTTASIAPTGTESGPSTNPGSNPYHSKANTDERPDPSTRPFGTEPPAPYLSDIIPTFALSVPSSMAALPNPLSSKSIPSIAHTRQYIIATTIPALQSLSQRLVLHALSTAFLTSSLSALVYVSVSTTSIYESGAIAAVGVVYALGRLQRKWEEARSRWMALLREEGRRVLRRVEDGWKAVVWEGGMGMKEDVMGREEREKAKRAVEGVRRELEGMERKD
ncbi:MAG: hypothetical protein Q9181_007100 [Wetmoreana brouardii]